MIQPRPIKLLRFPMVRILEDKIIIQSWRVDALPPGAEDLCDRVSMDVFGNVYADTEYHPPSGIIDPLTLDLQEDEHEAQFETDSLSDDQIVAFFLPFGLDFRDERGWPLRSAIFLARTAEAACKGIAGHLPALDTVDDMEWGTRLQAEADKYLRNNRRA